MSRPSVKPTRLVTFCRAVLACALVAGAACDETSVTSPDPDRIIIQPAEVTITIGETVQLLATVQNAEGEVLRDQPIQWVVEDGSVASISSTGRAQGLDVGSTTVTATSADATGTAVIVVIRTGV